MRKIVIRWPLAYRRKSPTIPTRIFDSSVLTPLIIARELCLITGEQDCDCGFMFDVTGKFGISMRAGQYRETLGIPQADMALSLDDFSRRWVAPFVSRARAAA